MMMLSPPSRLSIHLKILTNESLYRKDDLKKLARQYGAEELYRNI